MATSQTELGFVGRVRQGLATIFFVLAWGYTCSGGPSALPLGERIVWVALPSFMLGVVAYLIYPKQVLEPPPKQAKAKQST